MKLRWKLQGAAALHQCYIVCSIICTMCEIKRLRCTKICDISIEGMGSFDNIFRNKAALS